ncbi:hypothetical protein DNTS_006748 [Danionella cerebrum]|uniref:glycerol kinase n=1 Tax=Danionella cerebrum TaxID=2873325 RepID=A0A553QZP9_9TELE|nr:hypothetical protein DNTS_006748 [Danionella translucida]
MNGTMAASSSRIMLGPLVAAIDQGTSSTRFLVFNAKTAELLSHHQVEIKQSFPKEGWVEEDPKEILQSVYECMDRTCEKLTQLNIDISNIKAIGVTNQRETTLVWDKETGEPLYNAIVWLDLRTQSTVERLINKTPGKNKNHLKHKTGLPISTYFSAVKLRWLMDNVDKVHEAVLSHRAMFGTVDSWLIWCLTGGKNGGVHCTDVTNASRTMLFNIHSMEWDPELCTYFDIPMEILPRVRSSSEIYGLMFQLSALFLTEIWAFNWYPHIRGEIINTFPLFKIITSCLGDQSAALVGQMCFKDGQAKNTYGTGCFLLKNVGTKPVMSDHGLLTTVAYKLGREQPACYALEGSVAIAGAVVRWLKDNLGIIQTATELGSNSLLTLELLMAVTLFLRFLDYMHRTGNRAPEVKPSMPETTALGAAMAAGAAEGVSVWSLNPADITEVTSEKFEPQINPEESELRYARWKKAVQRAMNWETTEPVNNGNEETSIFSSVPLGFYIMGSMFMLIGAKYVAGQCV